MEDFSSIINDWLDRHPPEDRAEQQFDDRDGRRLAVERHAALRRMKPQASLDLHGSTVAEALERTDRFLKETKARGLQKVLIIHGKGLHSPTGDAVLRNAVREHIRNHRLAGETGTPGRSMGGDGAFWVVLR
jgi:DNA-nicking Smr family endonuclease